MATELENIANQQRLLQLSKNDYTDVKQYNSNNLDALSSGDEKGKGEYNGQIGSLSDINTRKENLIKNDYSGTKQYNSNNLDALSNGDEKGKGEFNGQVGSLSDINNRTDNMVKNKYGAEKTYPDFTV